MDAYANTLGVVVGGLVGLVARGIFGFVRKESAGGDELPVSLVLTGLSSRLRALADQRAKSGRPFSADSTIV
ncbi:MAG: hypothetical protein U9P12_00485 [Verrucomicrobiota bacterium]|nr:hypothetical protein [Verrucomicrobiota bacterium]